MDFQALIPAIATIKTLFLSELFRAEWCITEAGVKIILQRTLIKAKTQRLSAEACRTLTETQSSVIDNTDTHTMLFKLTQASVLQ